MELILISEKKLKVMLTAADMELYELTCDNLDYDNTETRRAFWNILDEAKRRTGFDAARDRVFVQVYPSKSGGCEMYVTKLRQDTRSATEQNAAVRLSPEPPEEDAVFAFKVLPDLLTVCGKLSERGCTPDSSVYLDENGERYFLVFGRDVGAGREPPYTFITEYGVKLDSGLINYIREHCDCICRGNAVRTLGTLA